MLPLKKNNFSFAQSTESDSNSRLFNIDVLCINCNEMINCDEIDVHSELCNKVSKKVVLMENSNIIDQTNFKIEKMLNSIEKLDYEINNKNYKFYSKTKKEDAEALESLKDLIKRIYIVNAINLDNIKILKEYAVKIHHMIKHFAGSPAILIYLERVKNLTKEKYQEMAQIDINYIKTKNNENSAILNKKNMKAPLQTIKEKESVISNQRSKLEDFHPNHTFQNDTSSKIQNLKEKPKNISDNNYNYNEKGKINNYSSAKKPEENPQKSKIFSNFSSNINEYINTYTEKSEASSKNYKPFRVDFDNSSENDDGLSKTIYGRTPNKSSSRSARAYQIDEINSETNRGRGLNTSSQSSVLQTEISRKKSVPSNQGEPADPFAFQSTSSRKKIDSDELQRYFYTKCLNAKMKHGSDSKVQRVSIALIYKEAMDMKIPQKDWSSFIENALKFPDKYLDLSKLKIRSNKKVLQNRLVECSKDKEYKQRIQK